MARIRDVAVTLDPAVEEALGFRASDLVELTLRYSDAAIRHAARLADRSRTGPDCALLGNDPARFAGETQSVPAAVTVAEVQAARRWWSADRLGDAAFRCSGRQRGVRALEWATADPGSSLTRRRPAISLSGSVAGGGRFRHHFVRSVPISKRDVGLIRYWRSDLGLDWRIMDHRLRLPLCRLGFVAF